jgi:hypothetical protein
MFIASFLTAVDSIVFVVVALVRLRVCPPGLPASGSLARSTDGACAQVFRELDYRLALWVGAGMVAGCGILQFLVGLCRLQGARACVARRRHSTHVWPGAQSQ